MNQEKSDLAPENIGVKSIPTDSLKPNPHNPRMLFDRAPLETLKQSIAKVGILVPLTVYHSKTKDHYIILDGQRRWMCARVLNLEYVPVNIVAEPTLVQNIVTMFQIHQLREDWELMPTALKLEVLMNALDEKNEKRLSELTGLDQAVVLRCKKLLSYPKKYQDMMLDPNPENRIKADFLIELYPVLNDRIVKKMPWYSKEKFIDRMLEKYQNRKSGFKSVTDFRIMKQHITNATKADKVDAISKKLEEFIKDDSLPMDHLIIKAADVSVKARKLLVTVQKLEEALDDIDVESFYGEEELWRSLEKLMKLIIKKLQAAGRRISI